MTYEEIFRNEDMNTRTVWLHMEGTFLRAHNQSAYLLCREIRTPLKVSMKYIKKEAREDYSVGFPASVSGRWLRDRELHEVPDSKGKLFFFTVERPLDEVMYSNWAEEVKRHHEGGKIVTRLTRLVSGQPVWKISFDVLMSVLDASANVSAKMKVIGNQAAERAMALCLGVTHFYDAPDRAVEASRLQDLCTDLAFTLYVLQQKKELSTKAFCENSERLAAVRGNLARLSKPRAGKDGERKDKPSFTAEGLLESLMKRVGEEDAVTEENREGAGVAQPAAPGTAA